MRWQSVSQMAGADLAQDAHSCNQAQDQAGDLRGHASILHVRRGVEEHCAQAGEAQTYRRRAQDERPGPDRLADGPGLAQRTGLPIRVRSRRTRGRGRTRAVGQKSAVSGMLSHNEQDQRQGDGYDSHPHDGKGRPPSQQRDQHLAPGRHHQPSKADPGHCDTHGEAAPPLEPVGDHLRDRDLHDAGAPDGHHREHGVQVDERPRGPQ